MLVTGVCNPRGERSQYNGLYLTGEEMQRIVDTRELQGVPVKTEHSGGGVGTVVSSFLDDAGRLHAVMDIQEDSVEGALTAGFIKDGIAADLSLGYSVDVAHSKSDDALKAGAKKLLEVSIVRKGAREGCHINAYSEAGKEVVFVAQQERSCWDEFGLQC